MRQGETAAQIAWKYGFSDVGTVWHHPDNRELAKSRPNPDVLKPGDKVSIPPHKAALFKLPADQETIRYTGFFGNDPDGKSFLGDGGEVDRGREVLAAIKDDQAWLAAAATWSCRRIAWRGASPRRRPHSLKGILPEAQGCRDA